jgi:enoyl-CoA hydratase
MPEGLVRELAYTGRNMSAEEAKSAGFINAVYPDRDAMMAGVREIAQTIASKAPLAMRGTKQVINFTRDHSVEEGLEYVVLWNASMMSKVEVQEAMTATMEKRAPQFDD